MVLMGVFKLIMSFFGERVRRAIPEAGLLGSIGGVGIALLGTLQLGEIYGEPIVGMMALGVIYLCARREDPAAVSRARGAGERRHRRDALLRLGRARTVGASRGRTGRATFPSGCRCRH